MYSVLASELEFEKILAIETDHCPQSFGCLVTSAKHGRIFYTADTALCQNVLDYARGVKLLITEATLENGFEIDAKLKKHQTTDQALKLIKKAKPYRAILTHFSARYSSIPEVVPDHKETKTLIAFDFMKVSWSQLEWAWYYTDVYASVINKDEHDENEDENTKTMMETVYYH